MCNRRQWIKVCTPAWHARHARGGREDESSRFLATQLHVNQSHLLGPWLILRPFHTQQYVRLHPPTCGPRGGIIISQQRSGVL